MNSKKLLASLLLAALMALAFAAAEAPRASLNGDFWAGLWDAGEETAPETDFWAGLWDSGEENDGPARPETTPKPGSGKLYKI